MPVDQLPAEPTLDSTVALLREGYTFVSDRARRFHSDAFRTRLMLRRATCVVGEEAARMFYAPERFTRRGALPPHRLMLLQDLGSAAVLDGEAHHWRKRMLMSLLAPARVQQMVDLFARAWRRQVDEWERAPYVVLDEAVQEVLCRSVCMWAGLDLADDEVRRRTREFGSMFDAAGAIGPRVWLALLLRRRTERWARRLIRDVRRGRLPVADDSAVAVIAMHRDEHGQRIPVGHAAVELINLLRPTVAVSRFITAQRARHHVLVTVGDSDRVALHAIAHVLSRVGDPSAPDGHSNGQHPPASASIQALHVTDDREAGQQLQQQWQDLGIGVQLVMLESPFRAPVEALLSYVEYLQRGTPAQNMVTIVIPETLPTRWWRPVVRNYLAWRLKWSLLFRPRVSVLSVPLALPD